MESLDEVFQKANVDLSRVIVCLESQNWGVGKEYFAVGSQEFMSQYAAKHGFCCLLDMAHFNPMENVADKISALMLFSEKVALHVARPVRHTCAHVPRLDDALRDVAREVVRIGPDRFLLALDYGDASMNRIAGLVQGARNVQLALLEALLMPQGHLARLQDAGRTTEEFVLSETLKTLPLGAVYAEFCRREGKPCGAEWLKAVLAYEKNVQQKREA
jgi:L-rhamnose isomerase